MNEFQFTDASLELVYQTGRDEYGDPVFASTKYSGVKGDLSATQLRTVANAIASLSADALFNAIKIQKDEIL